MSSAVTASPATVEGMSREKTGEMKACDMKGSVRERDLAPRAGRNAPISNTPSHTPGNQYFQAPNSTFLAIISRHVSAGQRPFIGEW
jgi:hypothetical protein